MSFSWEGGWDKRREEEEVNQRRYALKVIASGLFIKSFGFTADINEAQIFFADGARGWSKDHYAVIPVKITVEEIKE